MWRRKMINSKRQFNDDDHLQNNFYFIFICNFNIEIFHFYLWKVWIESVCISDLLHMICSHRAVAICDRDRVYFVSCVLLVLCCCDILPCNWTFTFVFLLLLLLISFSLCGHIFSSYIYCYLFECIIFQYRFF